MIVNQFPDNKISINGEKFLYFGGTNYLGITTNTEFQNILFDSIRQWGTGFGSSRNANVKLSIYNDSEKVLADFFQFSNAVTVTSGMLAGKIVVEYLVKNNDLILHLPDNHPALFCEKSLPVFENNILNRNIFDKNIKSIVILTDSYPTASIDAINLDFLNDIPKNITVTLLIDESHSIGITGTNGCGIAQDFSKYGLHRIVMTASLTKSFGLTGGVIASDFDFIEGLKTENAFVGASGMNPAFLQTFVNSLDIYNHQMRKLSLNIDFLKRKLMPNPALRFNGSYPLIYFNDALIYQKLFDNQIIVTSFHYPTPSEKLNRIVITANHTIEDLEKLITVLNTIS